MFIGIWQVSGERLQDHWSSCFNKIYISTDINECATGTPCNSGSCSNTPGTFTCDCTGTGFEGPTCSSGKTHKVTRA